MFDRSIDTPYAVRKGKINSTGRDSGRLEWEDGVQLGLLPFFSEM